MVMTIDEKNSLIKKLNKLDDYDFIQELGGSFFIEKSNDYDFKIIKEGSESRARNIYEWSLYPGWDYAIHFYMKDNEKEFSFDVEINEEQTSISWCPQTEQDYRDIKECIEEWGEYKPEHFRAFVWYVVINSLVLL